MLQLIVPYCTIGYRSGVFATKLSGGSLPEGCTVRNGQGVVCWSYAEGFDLVQSCSAGAQPAEAIHTFGSPWNLAHPKYRPEYFGYVSMALRGIKDLCS